MSRLILICYLIFDLGDNSLGSNNRHPLTFSKFRPASAYKHSVCVFVKKKSGFHFSLKNSNNLIGGNSQQVGVVNSVSMICGNI